MTKPIGDVLGRLEAELARRPVDYETLTDALGDLALPANVTAADLTRLYAACYRLLGIAADRPPIDLKSDLSERQAGFVSAWVGDVIEKTMYDSEASTRAWIARSQERFRTRGEKIPDGLNADSLPARLDIPWDVATAGARVRPFLERCEASIAHTPTFHFRLCWNVARNGYPVFQMVVTRWMLDLERRGLGLLGTLVALDQALALYDKADDVVPVSWAECERDIVPLLDHPHPMVAVGAARYIGALYAGGCFKQDARALTLIDVLERLGGQSNHRAAVCGGFVCGFDSMCEGLSVLRADSTPAAAGFDLDRWVIDVLAADANRDYLPNAQSFWFYVHEHYAAKPKFIMRLIDIDRRGSP